jgi:hypothetical protein
VAQARVQQCGLCRRALAVAPHGAIQRVDLGLQRLLDGFDERVRVAVGSWLFVGRVGVIEAEIRIRLSSLLKLE